MKRLLFSLLIGFFLAPTIQAEDEIAVTIYRLTNQGLGESIGVIVAKDSPNGLVFTPYLRGLTPGRHGFHVHENSGCGAHYHGTGVNVAGGAAGGHYDPHGTGRHRGPDGDGHLGDLPVLEVNDKGEAYTAVVAPRLNLNHIRGRSLMIHAGGDNYQDAPAPLGGGGARFACGSLVLFQDTNA